MVVFMCMNAHVHVCMWLVADIANLSLSNHESRKAKLHYLCNKTLISEYVQLYYSLNRGEKRLADKILIPKPKSCAKADLL